MNFTKLFSVVLCLISVVGLWSGCASSESGKSKWSLKNLLAGPSEGRSALDNRRGEEDFDVFGERNPDRLMLTDFGPGRIGTTLQRRVFSGQDRDKAETKLNQAHDIYRQAITEWEGDPQGKPSSKLFRKAANAFELAADRWPDSALEQDALFMQGEAHFFANDYVMANRAYETLLNRYPGTDKLDLVERRRFEIAQYWLELNRQKTNLGVKWAVGDPKRPTFDLAGQARRILHRIRLDDPTGKIADDATLALANAFFEAGLFADAADAYEDLRRTYPASPHQFHAHLFELRSRLASYRGPKYDGTDLNKSDELMKAIVSQFPNEADGEQEYLRREAGRIRNLLAERQWSVATYFENRGENRAAIHYYEQLAQNYGETEYAEEASQRVASLTGKPPVPPQKVPWLVNLFPEKERNKPLIATGNNESILR